jgi:tetratricopeptide (TPR) repeat protein
MRHLQKSNMIGGCLVFWLAIASPSFAFQSKAGGNEQQLLRDAQGAFADNNFLLARQKAEQIRDAQSSIGEQARALLKLIDDVSENNRKWQSARIAFQRRDNDSVCKHLLEIEAAVEANRSLKSRYPDLNSLKNQAGGCLPVALPPPPAVSVQQPGSERVDPVKADYEKALKLMDDGKAAEALKILKKIQRSHKNYEDVNQLVEDLTGSGGSQEKLQAQTARQPEQNTKKGRTQIEEASRKDKSDLVEAINAFYGGKYEQAVELLARFLERPHSGTITAFAHFYAGAAMGNKFYLSGQKDETSKRSAIQMFQQTLKADPNYMPRWDAVSPKIKDLYAESTRK